jgi:hypothetical protein
MVYLMKKNILRFEISVQDVIVMHVFNSIAHLLDHQSNLILIKSANCLQARVQVSRKAKLHEKIKVIIFNKDRVELDDVRMIKVTLNLYLSNYLSQIFWIMS